MEQVEWIFTRPQSILQKPYALNSECQIVAKGNLFTNCTNGIPVPDIKNHGNLYGTIVNIYINNISYFRPL
jgi:hypothetical protein